MFCVRIANGDVLNVIFEWKELDFAYPNSRTRQEAIDSQSFIPSNNVPVGLEVWKNKLFITVPRWKRGVPASLAYVFLNQTGSSSPELIPYPNWAAHDLDSTITPRFQHSNRNNTCIISPFRIRADSCDRLWVLDTGKTDILDSQEQVGPNQLLVYNLKNDELIRRYEIPKPFTRSESVFANIAVDVKNGSCEDTFAYMADIAASSMVVYSWGGNVSWRITHSYFHSDPKAGTYRVAGVNFEWTDGLFGLALSAENSTDKYRTLFFHPFSSFSEFAVSTRLLQNESLWTDPRLAAQSNQEFKLLGTRESNTQSSASFLDEETGILLYTQVTRNAVGCWNSAHEYTSMTQGQVAVNNITMVFPNDIKVDTHRNLWLLTDRMPLFMYRSLNRSDVNFRVLSAPVDRAVAGTVCARSSGDLPSPLGFILISIISSLSKIQ